MSLAIIGLALAAAIAAAQDAPVDELAKDGWTFVALSDETRVYMKHTQPKATGTVRRVWTAYDSAKTRERNGYAFLSVQSLGEYDCPAKTSRVLEEAFFAGSALKGERRDINPAEPTPWQPHAEGSVGEIRFEFACDVPPPGAA